MQPPPTQGSNTLKVIAAVTLIGLGVTGLVMSLCGGAFLTFTVFDLVTGTGGSEARQWAGFFAITGGASLVVGLLVVFLSVVAWKRVTAPRSL